MSEPVTPAGWAAILAAVLLPFLVTLTWHVVLSQNQQARDTARAARLETRILDHERELASLRSTVEFQAQTISSPPRSSRSSRMFSSLKSGTTRPTRLTRLILAFGHHYLSLLNLKQLTEEFFLTLNLLL